MEVFGPGEVRAPGEGGIALTAAIDLPAEQKVFVASWEDVAGQVGERAREGDVVVTMGAPPISLMGDELLAALTERAARRTAAEYVARHAIDEGEASGIDR
jgi:UDP-N-acetylmuramate--alanine ligase